ncbi:methyltransferase family protein [Magnetococcales bacterium HHB-1]
MVFNKSVILYLILWILFAVTHSLFASFKFKAWWCRLLGRYAYLERLLYNLFALSMAMGIFIFGRAELSHALVVSPPETIKIFLWLLHGCGWIILISATLTYDLKRFIGLYAIRCHREGMAETVEPFRLSWMHRFVRHPIYCGLLIVLWSRPWTVFSLWTNIFATLYLLVGTWLEERKLLQLYGERYQSYRQNTPPFFPFIG